MPSFLTGFSFLLTPNISSLILSITPIQKFPVAASVVMGSCTACFASTKSVSSSLVVIASSALFERFFAMAVPRFFTSLDRASFSWLYMNIVRAAIITVRSNATKKLNFTESEILMPFFFFFDMLYPSFFIEQYHKYLRNVGVKLLAFVASQFVNRLFR